MIRAILFGIGALGFTIHGDNNTTHPKEFTPPSIQCPILNATNYSVWTMKMKVLLKIYKVWDTTEPGTEESDKSNVTIVLLF